MIRRRFPYLLVVASIVGLDQLTKWLVAKSLDLHDMRPIVDGLLSLSHVRNRGAAFGILSDADLPYQAVLFSVLSLVALAAIAVYAMRLPVTARLPQLALSLVLGGAIGNLIDRLAWGHVVDFLQLHAGMWYWPAFNVADSAITIGAALVILDSLRAKSVRDGGN